MINRRTLIMSTGALMVLPSTLIRAEAASHEVQMLNKHPEDKKQRMVFYPHIIQVNAGDTVKWLPEDKGHNSESIKDMIPDGVDKWKGKLNKEIEVTFDKPGFYGYKCTPHLSLGMVGLVVVEGDGKLDNLEAAQGVKQRGKAKKVWQAIWEQAEADGLLEPTAA